MSRTQRELSERGFEESRKGALRRLSLVGLLVSPIVGGALFAQTVTFVRHSEIATGSDPVSFAIGDFNGDGKPDLAVVDQRSANVMILLGIGNGYFFSQVNEAVGVGPVAVATGDFDGDGKLDLVVANRVSNTVELLLGNGNGTSRRFTTLEAFGPRALAVGDFNGDGKLDIAVANGNSRSVSIWLGNGFGTFRSALDFRVGDEPVSIAVGDFNGDGKPDLAVANQNSESVSVFAWNRHGRVSDDPQLRCRTSAELGCRR